MNLRLALLAGIFALAACSAEPPPESVFRARDFAASAPAGEKAAPAGEAAPPVRCAHFTPERRAFFGDLHVHTGVSNDAWAFGVRAGPDDAYRYAFGGEINLPLNGAPDGRTVKNDRPLDFAAVTDHAEFLGESRLCSSSARAILGDDIWNSALCRAIREGSGRDPALTLRIAAPFPWRDRKVCGKDGARCGAAAESAWRENINAAEAWNAPCERTTFIAYEYSSHRLGSNLHRNVIFRNSAVPGRPVSYLDAVREWDLWRILDEACLQSGTGCDAIAIPHNSNISNGRMFKTDYPGLRAPAEQAARAQLRAALEPVVEIMQHKGDSECRNGLAGVLGGADELCDFEKFEDLVMFGGEDGASFRQGGENAWTDGGNVRGGDGKDGGSVLADGGNVRGGDGKDGGSVPADGGNVRDSGGETKNGANAQADAACYDGPLMDWVPYVGPRCLSRLSYVRYGLAEGLAQERRLGVNPFKLGIIASTDTHNGLAGAADERDFPGHLGEGDAAPAQRVQYRRAIPGNANNNPGGLAGIWAEQNSRDSLFDTLKRREVFGTSGPRIEPRLFAAWDLPDDLCARPDMIPAAYRRAVPMGSDLPPRAPVSAKAAAPHFLAMAKADPGTAKHPGTPLQRLQIIKAWADENGNHHQRVFNVAGNPANGAAVDLQTCRPHVPSGKAARQLCAVWQDPEFDPTRRAVYYMRAVENPTCRYSARQCLSLPPEERPQDCIDPPVPPVIQERAWSSPIWYTPST